MKDYYQVIITMM